MSAIDERRSEIRERGGFQLGPVFDDRRLLARRKAG
jgi:hypothetical protein